MDIIIFTTYHLVKGGDLNHHGTLFAGRGAEWFVESGFIAASTLLNPENIVCLKIHGMEFRRPVHKGEIVCYESRIVYAGKSSLTAYITMKSVKSSALVLEGFITFVHINEQGKPVAHGIEITAITDEEKELQQRAKSLKEKKR